MDNVKTFRLSSADLESLVTSPNINGHRLYHGQAGVPNYYTLFITLNGASLSKDFAQRVIPIRLARPTHRGGWEAEVDAFLAAQRERLLADLVGVLGRHEGNAGNGDPVGDVGDGGARPGRTPGLLHAGDRGADG